MPNGDLIKNKACVELELCGKKHTFESNEVEAKKIKIEVFKEQNCEFVFDDDKIEYTVKICNYSECNLYDVLFSDSISVDTDYVHDTFVVNGKKVSPTLYGNTIRYYIPEIKEKEDLVIKFEVKVK